MSKVYSIKNVTIIAANLEQVWDFFSVPENLIKITPADMGFHIISEKNEKGIYAGQIIEYTVRPMLGIPLYWMTEITHVKWHEFFVDEQRFGPFSMWHHQHHFHVKNGKVEMTDIVHYKLPVWILGSIAHALFVKKKVANIFTVRNKKIEEIFGKA